MQEQKMRRKFCVFLSIFCRIRKFDAVTVVLIANDPIIKIGLRF